MKPMLFAALVGFVLMPPGVSAQYSNASLNGPWIEDDGNSLSYLIFDGNGKITSLGTSEFLNNPVGTYTVQSGGSFVAYMNLVHGTDTMTGTLTSSKSASIYINALGPYALSEVTSTALIADTFAGTIYDSTSQQVKSVEITIDGMGNVASLGGAEQLSGKMFSRQNAFTGYLTGNGSDCNWQKIQLWGSIWNNVFQGPVKLGRPDSNSCSASGAAYFSKKSTGLTAVSSISGASPLAYPNPCYNEVELTGLAKGINYDVTLFDITGRAILERYIENSGGSVLFDLGGRATGLYFVRLTNGQDISVIKLVKHE